MSLSLHQVEDLFGEIPVTWPEVEAWVWSVVGLTRASWRWEWYVRGWNVPDKIRAAKARGDFAGVIGACRFCPHARGAGACLA